MSTLNPSAYQAVFDALKAIVAYDIPLRAGLLNQANNALHMAQLPDEGMTFEERNSANLMDRTEQRNKEFESLGRLMEPLQGPAESKEFIIKSGVVEESPGRQSPWLDNLRLQPQRGNLRIAERLRSVTHQTAVQLLRSYATH